MDSWITATIMPPPASASSGSVQLYYPNRRHASPAFSAFVQAIQQRR
ncbi:hypothetical protein [Comamonas sp.]|nr:hypothetical protein [Comamonas sp.]